MPTFSIDSPSLHNILKDIGNGRIQLPVFQRRWVWDDYHIRSLIASVSQSFPIGSVLTLQAGGTETRFKTRLFHGVNSTRSQHEPEILILDGQQRLTALYQSLMSERGVSTQNTRGQEIRRHYYLDMKACFENAIEREEAVLSYKENSQLHTNSGKIIVLSSPGTLFSNDEVEYKNEIFPVNKIFDYDDWYMGYQEYWNYDRKKTKFFNNFRNKVIEHFRSCHIPVIQIPRETSSEAICLVFEKVNTRGVTLTVFELLTASFAAIDNFDLRDDWNNRFEKMKERCPVLEELESINFLRVLALLATNKKSDLVSCKRRDILKLTLEDYKKWANIVEEGFVKAARFLHKQKVFKAQDLPYQTQLVPLAGILADLDHEGETPIAQQKFTRWYWCGVFGEMYGASIDTRFVNDFSEVTAWVRGTVDEPRTIREANFYEDRLVELRTRSSAAYKGVHALLRHNDGCRDFRTGDTIESQKFFDDNIDIHHIFPKAWCEKQDIKPDEYNSIINKTALSASTNRKIGGRAPSEYLQEIQEESTIDRVNMDEILTSHLISADALRVDDFRSFFETRKEGLLTAIGKAMGKKVIREGEDPPEASAQ